MFPLEFFGADVARELHIAGHAGEFGGVAGKLRGFVGHGLGLVGGDMQNPKLGIECGGELGRLFLKHFLVNNRVPVEYAPCLMTGELHRDGLGDTNADQIACGGATEVVKDQLWKPSTLNCGAPAAIEAPPTVLIVP